MRVVRLKGVREGKWEKEVRLWKKGKEIEVKEETGKAVFKALNKEPEVNNINFAQRAHEALLKRVHERNVKNAK